MSTQHRGPEWIEAMEKCYRDAKGRHKTPKQAQKYLEWADKMKLSPFGREVADILGNVFLGIYHIEEEISDGKVNWSNPDFIEVRLGYRSLSTFDNSELTWLVVLCHDRCVRLELSAVSHKHLAMTFHRRERGTGFWSRHPTMEDAISYTRQHLGLGIVTAEEAPDAEKPVEVIEAAA